MWGIGHAEIVRENRRLGCPCSARARRWRRCRRSIPTSPTAGRRRPSRPTSLPSTQPADPYAPVQQEPIDVAPDADYPAAPPAPDSNDAAATATTQQANTVPRDDLINAAEGVFGRGAQGLAGILENILRDQGEPIAYIAGQEAGGAFVFGVRYGSGVMRHRIEGDRTVYWTGPSLGFDVGADANKVFVLVYNLHDSQDLFRRYPAGEGHAYFVGGFSAQYMRRGDVVLIPIRLGVGLQARRQCRLYAVQPAQPLGAVLTAQPSPGEAGVRGVASTVLRSRPSPG